MSIIINNVYFGDCLDIMPKIPDGIIDMVLCDLPYGKTKNRWDNVIDPERLWVQYKRIIKRNGAIVLFGQDKFSAKMMLSNVKMHRYNLIWQKTSPTGYLNASRMLLRSHEDILVFYKKLPTYNPQKTIGHTRKVSTANHKRNSKKTSNYGKHRSVGYDSTERFPKSILTFATDKQKNSLHPNQKPLELIVYLIKTYSNEGDIILDNAAGSGTTGEGAKMTNRKYILIESDKSNYNTCIKRMSQA